MDRILLDQLSRDARTPNTALAALAGIAPSTCLGRVRALVERGVIRGVHADIDPIALGRDLQAMIAVRVQANGRKHLGRIGWCRAAIRERWRCRVLRQGMQRVSCRGVLSAW
ncbi:hypothetical protein CJ177_00015 [Rhodococcus sp. ACPA1]|nr:hypothetical protein CJ177_00015 [Rhodococcus sp. ACPA1]